MANRWKDTVVKKDKYTKKNLEMPIEKLLGENWFSPTSRAPMPLEKISSWKMMMMMTQEQMQKQEVQATMQLACMGERHPSVQEVEGMLSPMIGTGRSRIVSM